VGRLDGKVAFVTGAGQGIGEAIALKLAQEGASVTIAEINADKGAKVAAAILAAGHKALFIKTDITQENDISSAAEQTITQFGGLDIVVNNAGKNFYFDPAQMTSSEWDDSMGLDLKSAWMCAKYAIPSMVKAGGGSIINIASVHARMTAPGMFPYAAAKAGMVGMTRSMALDLGKHNIRVNAVCPGWVRTELVDEWIARQPDPVDALGAVQRVIALQRMAEPMEVANFVAFLASDEAQYFTGSELIIDGGLTSRFAT